MMNTLLVARQLEDDAGPVRRTGERGQSGLNGFEAEIPWKAQPIPGESGLAHGLSPRLGGRSPVFD
jgi:hypothetical protein